MLVDTALGLRGWQWLFILEGMPAVILAFCCLKMMPDRPDAARWLSRERCTWLMERLAEDNQTHAPAPKQKFWQVMMDGKVLALCVIYCGVVSVGISLSLWQPQIIKAYGLTDFQTGLLSSIPFGVATLVMVLWGRSSDRRDERAWHTGLPLALSGLALAGTLLFDSLTATIIILTLALIGTYAAKGPFWAMVTQWLAGSNAATSIAVVSASGSLASSFTTYLMGVIQESTGSFTLALLPLILLALVGTLLLMVLGFRMRPGREVATATRG
jgi:ACS family tartrate transporter-like MFS transporter